MKLGKRLILFNLCSFSGGGIVFASQAKDLTSTVNQFSKEENKMKKLVKANMIVTANTDSLTLTANRFGTFSVLNKNWGGNVLYCHNVSEMVYCWNRLIEEGFKVEECTVKGAKLSAPKKVVKPKKEYPEGFVWNPEQYYRIAKEQRWSFSNQYGKIIVPRKYRDKIYQMMADENNAK